MAKPESLEYFEFTPAAGSATVLDSLHDGSNGRYWVINKDSNEVVVLQFKSGSINFRKSYHPHKSTPDSVLANSNGSFLYLMETVGGVSDLEILRVDTSTGDDTYYRK